MGGSAQQHHFSGPKPRAAIAALGYYSTADVDLKRLAYRALDMAVLKAACPAQDKRASFVGVGAHDLVLLSRVATTCLAGQTEMMYVDLPLA